MDETNATTNGVEMTRDNASGKLKETIKKRKEKKRLKSNNEKHSKSPLDFVHNLRTLGRKVRSSLTTRNSRRDACW